MQQLIIWPYKKTYNKLYVFYFIKLIININNILIIMVTEVITNTSVNPSFFDILLSASGTIGRIVEYNGEKAALLDEILNYKMNEV